MITTSSTFGVQTYYSAPLSEFAGNVTQNQWHKDVHQEVANFLSYDRMDPAKLSKFQKTKNIFLAVLPFLKWQNRQTNNLKKALKNNNIDGMRTAIIKGARKLFPWELINHMKSMDKVDVGPYLSLLNFDDHTERAYKNMADSFVKFISKGFTMLVIEMVAFSTLFSAINYYALVPLGINSLLSIFLRGVALFSIFSFVFGFWISAMADDQSWPESERRGFLRVLDVLIHPRSLRIAAVYLSKKYNKLVGDIGRYEQNFYEDFLRDWNDLEIGTPEHREHELWKDLLRKQIERATFYVDIGRIQQDLVMLKTIPCFQEVIREFEEEDR